MRATNAAARTRKRDRGAGATLHLRELRGLHHGTRHEVLWAWRCERGWCGAGLGLQPRNTAGLAVQRVRGQTRVPRRQRLPPRWHRQGAGPQNLDVHDRGRVRRGGVDTGWGWAGMGGGRWRWGSGGSEGSNQDQHALPRRGALRLSAGPRSSQALRTTPNSPGAGGGDGASRTCGVGGRGGAAVEGRGRRGGAVA